MALVGILVALVGVAGTLGIFSGLVKWGGPAGDIRIWIAVAIVGALLAIFTRRARD